jgi:hypothetical protein
MLATEHAAMLEDLSERLLADFPQQVWRKAFLGPGYEWIRFKREVVTFLGTDSLEPDWTPDEIETLAARYGGRVELCARRPVLVFREARKALDVALLLQRTSGNTTRVALDTVRCTTAKFEVDGRLRRLTLGVDAANVCAIADRCARGTIHVSADTYHCLGSTIEKCAHQALVTTELEDDLVTSAAITLPPPPRPRAGAFGRLGFA